MNWPVGESSTSTKCLQETSREEEFPWDAVFLERRIVGACLNNASTSHRQIWVCRSAMWNNLSQSGTTRDAYSGADTLAVTLRCAHASPASPVVCCQPCVVCVCRDCTPVTSSFGVQTRRNMPRVDISRMAKEAASHGMHCRFISGHRLWLSSAAL